MLFIDDTGHGFELQHFDKLPVGYEYNDSGYKFWATGYNRNKEISIGHICSLTTYVAIDVSHIKDDKDNIDVDFINSNLNIELSTDSNVFSLLQSKDVSVLDIDNTNPLSGVKKVDSKDMVCTIIDGYLIVPIYVIGSSSEEGDWSSHVLIHLIDNSKEHTILGTKEQYCPIIVAAEFVSDIEKYTINLGNNGVQVPIDVMRAVYTGSGDQFDLAKYNEKLKEYLINIHTIHSQVGNYTSALDSLAWFDWSSLLNVTKLLQTDNDVQRQFIREHFNIDEHLLASYRYFRNSSLLSLKVDLDYIVSDSHIDSSDENKFYGEGHPIYDSLLTKTVDVVHGCNETVTYIKNYFDFSFAELGIKLSMLRYYYKQLFLPIHLDVASASLNQHVWANDIKMYNSASVQITEPNVLTDTKDVTVEFPQKKSLVISDQSHNIDDNFNVFCSSVQRDTMYIDEPCIFIPIRIKTINGRYKQQMFYNVNLILEKQIDADLTYYDRYCFSSIKDLRNVHDILLNNRSIFNDDRTHRVGLYTGDLRDALYKDIPKSQEQFKVLFDNMKDDTVVVLKLSSKLDDVLEFSEGDNTYIKESKVIYKETSKKLLESSFSFVQRLDDNKVEEHIYKGLVLPVAWLNVNGTYFDINADYKLRLLINNSWYSYDFNTHITEPEIHVGALTYKYDERFKQVHFDEDGTVKFNAYMYHPELVQINNKQYVYDLHRYIKDSGITSIDSSKLNQEAFYYKFVLDIDVDGVLNLNMSETMYNKLKQPGVYLGINKSLFERGSLHIVVDGNLYYIQSEQADNNSYDVYVLEQRDTSTGFVNGKNNRNEDDLLSIVWENSGLILYEEERIENNTVFLKYVENENRFVLYNRESEFSTKLVVKNDNIPGVVRDYLVPVQVHKLTNSINKYVETTNIISKKYLNRMHLFELEKYDTLLEDVLYIRRNFNLQFGDSYLTHTVEPEFTRHGTLKTNSNRISFNRLGNSTGIIDTSTDIVVSDTWHDLVDDTDISEGNSNIKYLYYTDPNTKEITPSQISNVYDEKRIDKINGKTIKSTFSYIKELDDFFSTNFKDTDRYYYYVELISISDGNGKDKELVLTNYNFNDIYNVLMGTEPSKYKIHVIFYERITTGVVKSTVNYVDIKDVKYDEQGQAYILVDNKPVSLQQEVPYDYYEKPYSNTQPGTHFYNYYTFDIDGRLNKRLKKVDPKATEYQYNFIQQDLESISELIIADGDTEDDDGRVYFNYLHHTVRLKRPEDIKKASYKIVLDTDLDDAEMFVIYNGKTYSSVDGENVFEVTFEDEYAEIKYYIRIASTKTEGYIDPHIYRIKDEPNSYVPIYCDNLSVDNNSTIKIGGKKLVLLSDKSQQDLYKVFFKETKYENIPGYGNVSYINDILNNAGILRDESLQYDMYLMHDTNKYYIVLISRETEADIINTTDLEFRNKNVITFEGFDKKKYRIKWQRSDDRFLINRMYIKDKCGNNTFSKDEVPVIYTTNYSNMWAAPEYDHKWTVRNKSVLTSNEETTYKNEYLILGENLKRGYYQIQQNYNISYIRNNYNQTTTTIRVD